MLALLRAVPCDGSEVCLILSRCLDAGPSVEHPGTQVGEADRCLQVEYGADLDEVDGVLEGACLLGFWMDRGHEELTIPEDVVDGLGVIVIRDEDGLLGEGDAGDGAFVVSIIAGDVMDVDI